MCDEVEKHVFKIVEDLSRTLDGSASLVDIPEILERASEKSIPPDRANRALDRLGERGDIHLSRCEEGCVSLISTPTAPLG